MPHLPATNGIVLGNSSVLILFHFWELLGGSSKLWYVRVIYKELVLFIMPCVYTQESVQILRVLIHVFSDWAQLLSFQYLLSLIITMIFVLLSKGCRTIYKVRSEWWVELVFLMSCARILMKGKWRQSAVGVLLGQQYSLGSTWPPSYFPLRKWFLL